MPTCKNCQKNYKIIPQELAFYKKHSYPLPRSCFECRRLARMKKRNPRQFWNRDCMCDQAGHNHKGKCPIEFQTTYSPGRSEIVYCEECYQKTIY